MLFQKEQWVKLREQHEKPIALAVGSKIIAENWKKLSIRQRARFTSAAAEAKARFVLERPPKATTEGVCMRQHNGHFR